ncbi:MAG: branched-chain alpha-keto acid dehydrogenase subunit E2 [Citromicrobium sp.]|nr:branched-chain alpha-keto acid dehydrogenase subunit E2 [Citromicrobium sp.]MAO97282.1 branched-chain alpha-keto acid dehydrogenase subunit E2 [Citromicrobium sp.]MBD76443.1 branched-chain alpha-keto acid dehydrogenase subunit E2 [Citromicrobium sp.]MBT47008.1 branched-chain alpha-keto acid dehydrogenase subunit E2 [Citromicrobium sp.]|tara:strand:+ start:942 stop:2264 length:1323 start_codon:yes stop_codon:yes gene_type:complete
MAKFTFNLPDIGEGIAEAEIVAWHVSVGDMVEEDQQIADMMTDKATVEMESPVAGKVIEIAGEVGDTISVGSMLVTIEVEGEIPDDVAEENAKASDAEANSEPKPAPAPKDDEVEERIEVENPDASDADDAHEADPEPAPKQPVEKSEPKTEAKVLASPAVRKRAKDLGIDLAQVKPAEDGRVRHGDLDQFLAYSGGYSPASGPRADEEIKVIGMRRRIAQNMSASKRNIPHFTYVDEVDVTDLEAMRAQLNDGRGDKPKLTILPLLITAICQTLPEFPMMNATYDDDAGVVTRHGSVNMGMAAQTDAGLMVPVLHNAQGQNIWQLAREIGRLAEAARSGKAKSEEMQGGTLTVTSLGPLGGIATTPVINRPEVAIIGPNKIVERPMFVTGSDGIERVEKRKLMNISISCDHRVVDGWDGASFIQALKRRLEAPALILAS